ncbi:MAG TPA: 3'-5' exonuclease [Candidatus Limnocylindria bacterium]|nr:3'-5' exonuclease [Candidatus Limnocylindria bacterium]
MHQDTPQEALVSVDVEASGPSPSTGSLLSIGACLVDDPRVGVYLELQPLPDRPWTDGAARVHGLDRARLEREGLPPAEAVARLEAWLKEAVDGRRPVFVGFNAPFDWMFVADYFERYLGRNPFGPAALDMKSYFMGRERIALWADTTHRHVRQRFPIDAEHTHNALDDAREQAELMQLLRHPAY